MLTIMYQDRALCDIDPDNGSVRIGEGLPLNLYLEEGDSLDTRINNLANFQHWCATRTLTLDRVYAKAILNACALRAGPNRQRARRDRPDVQVPVAARPLPGSGPTRPTPGSS